MILNWKLNTIYSSDEEWEKGKDLLIQHIEKFENSIANFLDNEKSFQDFIKLKVLIDEEIERVYCYPRRYLDLDINDRDKKEKFNEAIKIYGRITNNTTKFESEIINNKDKVLEYLNKEDLAYYKRFIEIIFSHENYLSQDNTYFENTQNIRNKYQELMSNKMQFGKVLINGEEVLINDSTYNDYIDDDNQEIRKNVFDSFMDSYKNLEDEIFTLFIEKLNNDIRLAKSKGYSSLKEMKLSEMELPDYLIDKTVLSVNKYLPLIHRFISLKKELASIGDYHTYDSSLPKHSESEDYIEFEDAANTVRTSLNILGSDYLSYVDEILSQGSIDAYPKDGKKTLNATSITYAGIPYVCLNYMGKSANVRTLAHELGHAVNLLYSKSANDFIYFEFSLFITEVIAKVNEYLYNYYLINKDRDENNLLNNLTSVISSLANSLFSQVMLTEFEDTIVKCLEDGQRIDKKYISDLYENLLVKYNGSDFKISDNDKYGWLKIGHFILQESYYLYQYSISTALANSICFRILNEKEFKDKYLEFLKIGNRMNIIDSLNFLGISLDDENLFDNSFEIMSEFIDEYERKVKKA